MLYEENLKKKLQNTITYSINEWSGIAQSV
jgi:hypothetical protein